MHIESIYDDPFLQPDNQTHVLFSMNDLLSKRSSSMVENRDPSGVDQERAESSSSNFDA